MASVKIPLCRWGRIGISRGQRGEEKKQKRTSIQGTAPKHEKVNQVVFTSEVCFADSSDVVREEVVEVACRGLKKCSVVGRCHNRRERYELRYREVIDLVHCWLIEIGLHNGQCLWDGIDVDVDADA